MAIFAIIQQPGINAAKLPEAVQKEYGESLYQLSNGVWLISDQATAQQVSEKVLGPEGEHGAAVVLEAGSYFGRANPAIWTWIKANWGALPNG